MCRVIFFKYGCSTNCVTMSELSFKRVISKSSSGYYHLSIPPEIGKLLSGPVAVIWSGGKGFIVKPLQEAQ